ncbi:hypothetical protein [Lentzea guizhouensis]|uniref:hypothetical protein n=1 Tax=Lentzea guizhouensis TaxID=1586287 RepID=UPI001C54CA22|nr:hypothetical protein [Lentzea guizhouensis]
MMGHLALADEPGDPANAWAAGVPAGRGDGAAGGLRPWVRHLAATSATLTDPARTWTGADRSGAGRIDPSGTTALRRRCG